MKNRYLLIISLFLIHTSLWAQQQKFIEGKIADDFSTESLQKPTFEEWKSKIDPFLLRSAKGFSDSKVSKRQSAGIKKKSTIPTVSSNNEIPVFIRIEAGTNPHTIPGFRPEVVTPSGIIASGWITVSEIESVASRSEIRKIESSRIRSKLDKNGRTTIRADIAHAGGGGLPQAYQGEGVIVGVLDSGIYFESPDFKDENGSRILFLLDMQEDETNAEFTKEQLDADESLVTQRDGFGGGGHGTHVAGSAAGGGKMNADFTGIAPKSDIIFVKGVREPDSDGGFFDTDVIFGIDYIFKKAAELSKPAVVNLSLGGNYGPLDGSSLYEQAITDLQGAGKVIVAAAGNEGFDFIHSGFDMQADTNYFTVDLPLDDVSMEKQVWYDKGAIDAFRVFAILPESPSDVEIVDITDWIPIGGDNESDESGILLYDVVNDLPAGYLWHYSRNTEDVNNGDGELNIYIEDGQESGAETLAYINDYYWGVVYRTTTGGRFDATNTSASSITDTYTAEDAIFVPGDRSHSVGSPATAKKIVSVGAFVTTNTWTADDGNMYQRNYPRDFWNEEVTRAEIGEIAYFSSRGPTRDNRLAPLISAPGDIIFSVRSGHITDENLEAAAMVEDGKYIGSQGTSMASPHAAGVIALMLQANPNLDYAGIAEIFEQTATKDSQTGEEANMVWGHGKIDALRALQITTNVSVEQGILPSKTELHQNYPNPFNPNTIISFTLAQNAEVSLEIFNVLGQKVMQFDQRTFTAGMHSFSVDASNLAGGVYMYRLQAGSFSETKMMTLLK